MNFGQPCFLSTCFDALRCFAKNTAQPWNTSHRRKWDIENVRKYRHAWSVSHAKNLFKKHDVLDLIQNVQTKNDLWIFDSPAMLILWISVSEHTDTQIYSRTGCYCTTSAIHAEHLLWFARNQNELLFLDIASLKKERSMKMHVNSSLNRSNEFMRKESKFAQRVPSNI